MSDCYECNERERVVTVRRKWIIGVLAGVGVFSLGFEAWIWASRLVLR